MTAPTKLPIAMPQSVAESDNFDYRKSYWKTVALAALAAGGTAIAIAFASGFWASIVGSSLPSRFAEAVFLIALAALFAWAALLVTGGLIAIRRDRLEAVGRPYDARVPRESSPTHLGMWLRSTFRFGGSDGSLRLCPGEEVEVRSLEEILATLDASGMLDGLPFMPEMAEYCGRRMKVFRRVDKLNDWIRGTGLRRVRDVVQLDGFRCTGSAHGGCQANCHPRWKEAWLRRTKGPRLAMRKHAGPVGLVETDLHRLALRETPDGPRFMCQATELTSGSEPLAWGDPRHFLRDVTTGNIRFRPWSTGVAIACFNWVQKKRRGVTFPYLVGSTSKTSPSESLGLRPGELVRVKSKDRIAVTLNDRNRNRGLWFDREMLRFCGGEYRVSAVLERVMVESTGALRQLTTPCIVLEGVTATGEYLGFNPEDEHIFWREIWLERVSIASNQ